MKTILLILSLMAFQLGNAQNITFSDPLLKGALIDSPEVGYSTSFIDLDGNIIYNVDTNSDGEISIAEAQNIKYIDFYYLPFTNLEGIQFFTNVKTINSLNSYVTTFNLPELVNLEELNLNGFSGQQTLTSVNLSSNLNLKKLELNTGIATFVDLSNNINLRELSISGSFLNALNLDNLSNLRKLNYYGNLPTIDISDCIKLIEINIGYITAADISLSSIDLTNQPLLINLNISNTNITSLNLSNNLNLENVYLQSNLLQNINFGNLYYVKNLYCEDNQITTLDLNNFQNLEVLSCSNNNLTNLKLKNFKSEQYVNFSGNPNLAYVCCDPEQLVYIRNQALLNGNYDTVVDSECSSQNLFLGTDSVSNNVSKISLFPNPVKDFITIDSKTIIDTITIYDVNGRQIKTFEKISNKIDVSSIEKGVYFLKATTNNEFQTLKFIKK